jgi:hypothetical protein
MTSLDDFTRFIGWCTVINISIYAVSTLILASMNAPLSQMHAKIFGLAEAEVLKTYFQFLGHYKLAILVFNLVPYIVLKIVKKSN